MFSSAKKANYLLGIGCYLAANEQGIISVTSQELESLNVIAIFPVGELRGELYKVAVLSLDSAIPAELNHPCLNSRSLLTRVSDEYEYRLLATALQVIYWNYSFKYCPRCAAVLSIHRDELAKVCTSCNYHQYPRISPCIIVLVRKGERCLLAYAKKFVKKRYSLLAGFIEAGESAEKAVAREVMEEVGIRIKNIEYCFSQSWPFPHSLMLGYMADYAGGEICPDGEEILAADWFGIDELPPLPPGFTIARRLIDKFFVDLGADLEPDSQSALLFPTE